MTADVAAALSSDDRRRIGRLIRRTAHTARFQMCVIEVASPRERRAVEGWIRGQMPDGLAVRCFDLGALPGENLWAELTAAVDASQRPRGWVFMGLEELPPDAREQRIVQLNVQRDSLVRDFPGLWFVLVHRSLRGMLMRAAPDFLDYAVIRTRREDEAADASAARPTFTEPAGFDWRAYRRPPLSAALRPIADAIDAGRIDRADDMLGVIELAGEGTDPLGQAWLRAELRARRGDIEAALADWSPDGPAYWSAPAEHRPVALRCLGQLLTRLGAIDAAERLLRERALPLCEASGDEAEGAEVWDALGDIAQLRGQWDEALRIRREEELPVFEKLGDVRSRTVTMGKVADILESRGELDEALRIWREEQLPAYEKLGDVRSRAVAMGRVADILQSRGELDEALRIRREEQLPVYEKLGDVRERAVTMGQVANILQSRGELDEALRIRREEELPVYEKLGDNRELVIGRVNLALGLVRRQRPDQDRGEVTQLLTWALAMARSRRYAEAGQIAEFMRRLGFPDAVVDRIGREPSTS